MGTRERLRAPRTIQTLALAGAAAVMLITVSGCGVSRGGEWLSREWGDACGECHEDMVGAQASGPHATVGCAECHADVVTSGHAEDPENVAVAIDWTIDGCGKCHAPEADTYLYDDNVQVGPFGGSQREPAQPKSDTFPLYGEVVAGHPFAREYNEEGAHAYMLLDHYETSRGKFETCVQCKSTKVAYAWKTGMPITTAAEVKVTLTHTETATQTAQVVTIPAGTHITWSSTDTYLTQTRAELPDGTVYTSYDATESAASKDYNMTWAATIAAIDETMPYGAGCNHCHDPHSTRNRTVRLAMERAIEEHGINPYAEDSPTSFEEANRTDQNTTLCAQCHVEYVCGKSSVDDINRDYFSWSKAGDLHDLYLDEFDYSQDWTHKIIGEPLIKSQHPETELSWNSPHHRAGVSCVDCHMPRVKAGDGTEFRSHWFTSPYKYQNAEVFASFAAATKLQAAALPTPCSLCHENRTARAIEQQQTVYERQVVVQEGLARSAALLGEVNGLKDAGGDVDAGAYDSALENHRKAHVLWENLLVSENSMGFHNFGEVMGAMADAEKYVTDAIATSEGLLN